MKKTLLAVFVFAVIITFSSCASPTPTKGGADNIDFKEYTNDLFGFSVPSDWDVSVSENNDFYTIDKNGETVGQITDENIPPAIDDILFSLKPSLGEVYYSKTIDDLFTEAAMFKYERSYNDGNLRITKDITEIGFVIDKNEGVAIKFTIETGFVTEDILVEIAKTFHLKNSVQE